ncbi:Protein kinase superfamily protein [Abeliophyllum distichum]|uniref:Protein kinase superfamily protein n=1 Tax=Abeliophyllum distichum TaxID=126358 RepID=A0ABD1TDV6_9LAMI
MSSNTNYEPPPSENNETSRAIAAVLSIVIFIVIGVVACCCAKKMRKAIVSDLRAVVAPPTQPPSSVIQVWEVDAPTMERFLRDLAQEKPVRFTAQQLCSFTSNYITMLGCGGFGKVYKGQFPNGDKIAVKVLNRSADRSAEEQFMAEVGTIGKTHHINLVRLYGFCYDPYMSALVYEYMENGSLDKFLFSEDKEIEWERLHEIAVGTAKGLAYLHEECQQRIIHYDIKPGNVLLDSNFYPKVADFGLAKLCNRDATHNTVTGYRGTPGYAAPEFMLKNFPISYKCDVYSFGLGGVRERRARGTNTAYGIEEKDRAMAEKMSMVALWCVQDSPEARPPMSAVVKMLEGGVEIMPPPKPFHYLFSVGVDVLKLPNNTGSDSTYSTSGMNSYWYKETTTPVMEKYEIQIASA